MTATSQNQHDQHQPLASVRPSDTRSPRGPNIGTGNLEKASPVRVPAHDPPWLVPPAMRSEPNAAVASALKSGSGGDPGPTSPSAAVQVG